MYYKQLTSGGLLIAIGETPNGVILPKHYIQIDKNEYESLKMILTLNNQSEIKLTPLNEKGELNYASV